MNKGLFRAALFLSLITTSLVASQKIVAQGLPGNGQEPQAKLECRYLTSIEDGFLNSHIKYSTKSKELEKRVIDQHIKRLDPSKIYLLASDEDQIKKIMSGLFEKTKKRNCSFLMEAQGILLKRMEDRKEAVKKFLDKNYKFNPKTEFVYDPDHKPFPKTEAEANSFIQKYVQFQIANYLATDIKINEAKEKVIKNYERAIRRVAERTEDDVYADYLDSFARGLDPHSSFFSRDVLDDFEIQMKLSLEGIGATLSSQDGFTMVEALVPGGAAARSGLVEPQDKIIAVGQEEGPMENVVDMDLKDVVKKIRGPKDSKVRLSILRKVDGKKTRLEVTITRDKVNLEDEAVSILYQDKEVDGKKIKIGIINFPSFYASAKRGERSSAVDMKKVIKQARENHVDGLVVDLSSNGGGSLEDAVKIAGLFFATGNVVKQSSRNENKEEAVLADHDPEVDWRGPLVLLTSRISASASEILAGTLKDYKRAIIVGGDHTFGKGSVQSVHPIPFDLGAIKVTVGMFFIPGGNSTQHRGVDSDIIIPSPYTIDDLGEKFLDYSLEPKKIPPFLSPDAKSSSADSAWLEVKPEWISQLKKESTKRVSKNTDFNKIISELKKSKKKGKTIHVADILNDKDKAEKDKEKKKNMKYGSKEEREKEYLKRADIVEATNVLTDLIKIEAPLMAMGKKEVLAQEKKVEMNGASAVKSSSANKE